MAPVWAEQYDALGEQIRFLEQRRTEIKKNLSGLVEDHGYEDDRGSLYYDVTPHLSLKKEKRVTQSFNEDVAFDVIEQQYPDLVSTCIETVEVVNQDALLAAFYEEKITEQDFNRCFPKKITYAFKVVRQEESDDEG